MRNVIFGLGLSAFAACAVPDGYMGDGKVRRGMTEAEVIALAGQPSSREVDSRDRTRFYYPADRDSARGILVILDRDGVVAGVHRLSKHPRTQVGPAPLP